MKLNNIWIFNHYATNMFKDRGGRHYYFAKNLIERGYDVTIFCASTVHNSSESIDMGKNKYLIETVDKIKFVFVKNSQYTGNGKERLLNMWDFFYRLFSVTKSAEAKIGKPDIIYASSVHPLTCLAGIFISRRYKVRCIVEIRDLWPLTLVDMGKIKKNSIMTNILYMGEHWIYKKADSIIFTMEGGKDYIIDKGWNKDIDLDKIYHINNGVDLKSFDYNKDNEVIDDPDLNEDDFKIIYTGAIRNFNSVENIVNAAKMLYKNEQYSNMKFLIYGDGTDRERLINICKNEKINNVFFKGVVDKKYIPYILSKSKLNLLIYNENVGIFRYGGSQNKLFEYLASGRPVVSNIKMNFSILDKYNCGMSSSDSSAYQLMQMIIRFYGINENEYKKYCENARQVAKAYDFKILTNKLEEVIKNTIGS